MSILLKQDTPELMATGETLTSEDIPKWVVVLGLLSLGSLLYGDDVLRFGIMPTWLFALMIRRECRSESWTNRNPIALGLLLVPLGLATFVMATSDSQRLGAIGRGFGYGVYAVAGLYLFYLTAHFAWRTWHYYRLPDLTREHLDAQGQLDPQKVIRDQPTMQSAASQKSWVSHNQALRASQALSRLTGNGKATEIRPAFLATKHSKVEAAGALIRAYAGYVRGFRGEYLTQHEENHYQALKRRSDHE